MTIAQGLVSMVASDFLEDAAENKWDSNTYIVKAAQRGLINNPQIIEYGKIIKERENLDRMGKVEMEAQAALPREEAVLTGKPVGFEDSPYFLTHGLLRGGEAEMERDPIMSLSPAIGESSPNKIRKLPHPQMLPRLTIPGRMGAQDQRELMAAMAGKQIGGRRIAPEEVEATTTYAGMQPAERPIDVYREKNIELKQKKLDLDAIKNARNDDLMDYRWATFAYKQLQDDLKDEREREDAIEKMLVIGAKYAGIKMAKNTEIAMVKKGMAAAEKQASEMQEEFDQSPYLEQIAALETQKEQANELHQMFKQRAGERSVPTGKRGAYQIDPRGTPRPKAAATPEPAPKPTPAPKTDPREPVKIKTRQDYYNLPVGRLYINPTTGAIQEKQGSPDAKPLGQ